MEIVMKVTSTEFQQNVGRYQDAALQAPVAITKNGRTHTVLMSASFFEMVMKGRVARKVEDIDDDTLKAIANSAVGDEFAHLDALVKDDGNA
jgi:PHD/YefM family antitoxin component YafN of YafNO toxin-antitoxin module